MKTILVLSALVAALGVHAATAVTTLPPATRPARAFESFDFDGNGLLTAWELENGFVTNAVLPRSTLLVRASDDLASPDAVAPAGERRGGDPATRAARIFQRADLNRDLLITPAELAAVLGPRLPAQAG